jgi:hypothetical protein
MQDIKKNEIEIKPEKQFMNEISNYQNNLDFCKQILSRNILNRIDKTCKIEKKIFHDEYEPNLLWTVIKDEYNEILIRLENTENKNKGSFRSLLGKYRYMVLKECWVYAEEKIMDEDRHKYIMLEGYAFGICKLLDRRKKNEDEIYILK